MFKLFRVYRLVKRMGGRKTIHTLRHLPSYLRYYAGLFTDVRTPVAAKAWVVGMGVYVLSPLDFLPDVIPFFGELDDLALILFALGRFHAMCPPQVRREHAVRCGLAEPLFSS